MQAEVVERKGARYTVILVASSSNPTKQYRVDVTNKRCDCPAWKFSKTRQPCKHLRSLGFTAAPLQPIEVLRLVPDYVTAL